MLKIEFADFKCCKINEIPMCIGTDFIIKKDNKHSFSEIAHLFLWKLILILIPNLIKVKEKPHIFPVIIGLYSGDVTG